MALAIHALVGHARVHARETAADPLNDDSDFASLIDGTAASHRGGGSNPSNSGNIEPYRVPDDGAPPPPHGDPLMALVPPPPHGDPLAGPVPQLPHGDPVAGDHGNIEPFLIGNAGGGQQSGSNGGGSHEPDDVGDIEPYNIDLQGLARTSAEGSLIAAMRDASMRFESMSALLRLTQAI